MRLTASEPANRCVVRDDRCMPVHRDTEWFRDRIGKRYPHQFTEVLCREGDGPIALLAPHGGRIEPYTEQIAGLIANELGCTCYCFCSGHTRKDRGGKGKNDRHHITSSCIEAPELMELLGDIEVAVSVHGLGWQEADVIEVGGRHEDLRCTLRSALSRSGFLAVDPRKPGRAAKCSSNIVNRCKGGAGVQLEISQTRYRSPKDGEARIDLAKAIAGVLKRELMAEDRSSEM